MIERSIYIEAENPPTSELMGSIGYTGAGLEREEILKSSSDSDNYQHWRVRRSPDNGCTWSAEEEVADVNVQLPAGGIVTYPGAPQYAASSNRLCRISMRKVYGGERPDLHLYLERPQPPFLRPRLAQLERRASALSTLRGRTGLRPGKPL